MSFESQQLTLQQVWANQYNALKNANTTAQKNVENLGVLGGVSETNTNGNFTSDQLKTYDQVKQQHVNANAALTAFLRDTSLNYLRDSAQQALVAASTNKSETERSQANVSSQALAQHVTLR